MTAWLHGRLQRKLETAEEELFELETKWTAAKMRVQQLRVQARSAEEMAQRTRSSAQVILAPFLSFCTCTSIYDPAEDGGSSMTVPGNKAMGSRHYPLAHGSVNLAHGK